MAASNLNLGKASGGVLNVQPADGTTNTNLVLPASGTVVATDVAVTDNAIARYDGTTGKLQNSSVVIDDSGNVGVGVTPSASGSATHGIQTEYNYMGSLGGGGQIMYNAVPSSNVASKYVYTSLVAVAYEQNSSGQHIWKTAPAGTSGSSITWTNAMILDANGDLLLQSGTGALGYGTGAGGQVTQLTSKSTAVTLNKPSGKIVTASNSLEPGAYVQFLVNNNLVTANDTIVLNLSYSLDGNRYSYRAFPLNNAFLVGITNVSTVSIAEAITFNFTLIKGANS